MTQIIKELIEPMRSEFQDIKNGQTILKHGIGVYFSFKKIYTCLSRGESALPLPSWLFKHKEKLLNKIESSYDSIKTYLIYHDCGKPFCLTIDADGRRHFPNHAAISQEFFAKHSNNELASYLIGADMLCHTAKPKDAEELKKIPHIEILLCAALAALYANAEMFGGFSSESFKIKFKNLSKLGERILN